MSMMKQRGESCEIDLREIKLKNEEKNRKK